MLLRFISGILLAVFVVIAVLFFPVVAIKAVVVLLVGVGCHEAARMILPRHPTTSWALPVLLGMALSAVLVYGEGNSWLLLVLPVVLFLNFSVYLFRHHSLDLVLSQVAGTVFIVLYFGFLFSYLGMMVDLPHGRAWLFLVLATTFMADTGAYFSGRYFGRRKLAPQVSPGKTVAGFFGGLISSIAVAFIIKYLFFNTFSSFDCVTVGFLVGVFGPLGDLAESLLKRSVGVKDSGTLIPGHGGLLDRVDALLFTGPVVYWYALYLK